MLLISLRSLGEYIPINLIHDERISFFIRLWLFILLYYDKQNSCRSIIYTKVRVLRADGNFFLQKYFGIHFYTDMRRYVKNIKYTKNVYLHILNVHFFLFSVFLVIQLMSIHLIFIVFSVNYYTYYLLLV